MIYLIGGPPRCGKTTAARQLAGAIGCSWVQGDWLTQAFSAYIADAELSPTERLFDPGPDVPREHRNDVLYARYSADEIVAYYRAWAIRSWPGLYTFIEYAIADGEDFVVEGYQVDPALVAKLVADVTLSDHVRAVFVVREDVQTIRTSIKQGSDKRDWVVAKTHQEVTFERIAQMIARYSEVVRAEAEQRDFAVFNMDHAFNRQIEQVVVSLGS